MAAVSDRLSRAIPFKALKPLIPACAPGSLCVASGATFGSSLDEAAVGKPTARPAAAGCGGWSGRPEWGRRLSHGGGVFLAALAK
jgi:hypothetical protein